MRRISLALALIGAVAGCSGNKLPSSADTSTGVAKGVPNVNYYVNFFSAPLGGYVTSDTGGINCGAASINAGVPTYLAGHSTCGTNSANTQTQFPWSTGTVTLTAHPDGTNTFIGWGGDCTGPSLTCTLTAGPDKMVVAVFGAAGSGHANFIAGTDHAAAYAAGDLRCVNCHGPTLLGKGIAPSCAACHAMPPAQAAAPTYTKTGLVAVITSINPTTSQMTFTLKDGAGKNVDVTGVGFAGESGKNVVMPVTVAEMNFGVDGNGNVLPFKASAATSATNVAGQNPATVTAFNAITSMNITAGIYPPPIATAALALYPDGSITQGATVCSAGTPCVCSSTTPCVFSGKVGAQAGVACTDTAPCTCTSANPCSPPLAAANAPGALTYSAGVYTFTFPAYTSWATTSQTTGTAVSGTSNSVACTVAAPCTCAVAPNNCACTAAAPCEMLWSASAFPSAAPYTTNTNTAWLATYRRENLASLTDGAAYTAANVQFNFDAATGSSVAAKREIVSDAACARCHDGFQPKAVIGTGDFHSSARVGATYCAVCHYEGRGTSGFADSATFVHRIHAAEQVGLSAANWFHSIGVTYPQDVRNCTECHTGAKAGQYLTRPTIAACGSCHEALAATFLPVGGVSLPAHPASNPGVRTNADCAGCHTPALITSVHMPVAPPAADNCLTLNNATGCNANTNAAYVAAAGQVPSGAAVIGYVIGSVSTWDDAGTPRPQMTFKLTKDGSDVVFNDKTLSTEIMDGFMGAPSLYFVWSQPQDGIAAPQDFNASASVWLRGLWNGAVTTATLTGPDGSGFYTAQIKNVIIPASAKLLTGGIGYSYNNTSSLPLTQTDVAAFPTTDVSITAGKINGVTCTVAAPCAAKTGGLIVPTLNAKMVATGFTGRRNVVDNAKCNACHAALGVEPTFHAGQRNDAPSCSWCHNPNRSSSGWSANASTFIHGIHGGEKRTVGFNWHAACQLGSTWDAVALACKDNVTSAVTTPAIYYPGVEYPGHLADCQQCHVSGGYDFSTVNEADLLWTTAASGTAAIGTGMSISPYINATTIYGAGYSVATATGVATAAAGTTLVSSPIAAACFSCHDSATAQTHMTANGGFIYTARSTAMAAGTNTEQCLGCHGPTAIYSIDAVHQ